MDHFPCLYWVDGVMISYGIHAQQHWIWFTLLTFITSVLAALFSYLTIER